MKVKNWARFQHYKNRKPPWIKLYRDLLDDQSYMSLPLASMALAPCIWLLASESDGEITDDLGALAWRLRQTVEVTLEAVEGLLAAGFLVGRYQDASNVLADCKQLAIPERERETERETEKERRKASRFAPPSPQEVTDFVKEKKYHFDPVGFWNYYESVGWKVGNKPMKKWQSACVTWETRWKTDHPELQAAKRGPVCPKCLVRPPSVDPPSQFCPVCLEGILADADRKGVRVK